MEVPGLVNSKEWDVGREGGKEGVRGGSEKSNKIKVG